MQTNPKKQILLVGNPNVGKSTVFNLLCNKKQKTGNYAGVTVASHSGKYVFKDEEVEVIDLPGSYSIYPVSYTHLDVYKRQEEEHKLRKKIGFPWKARPFQIFPRKDI